MPQRARDGAFVAAALMVVAVFAAVVVTVLVTADPPVRPPDRPPPAVIDDAVVAQALDAAVLVTATGCPLESIGGGAVIVDGVVTNAHVVAGATEVVVTTAEGQIYGAQIRSLDNERDLALLHVPGLDRTPLETAAPVGGTQAVALVRAGDTIEPLQVVVERTITIFTSDIYGEGRHQRRGMELRADVDPGDSGAGIIDADGALIGVVFSSSRRTPDVAYAVSATELETLTANVSDEPVDAGECL